MTQHPRVAVVVTSHLTALSFLPGFTRHLAESGWEVTVVCSPGDGLERLCTGGVDVRTVAMARDPRPLRDIASLRDLGRVFADLRPDVVLTATPKAGLLGTVAARLRGVPVVVHLMWGLRSETLRGLRRWPVQVLETVATRGSHRVVANSGSLRDELRRQWMVHPGRVAVLGSGSSHGVDVERFAPDRPRTDPELSARLDRLGDGPVVGYLGRLNPDKGVPELVVALRRLRERGVPCRLLVVGSAEDLSTVELVRQAIADGLPLLLVDNRDDTETIYHAIDVHCLPTWREGFPNVCLEAAACGVPTVTTDATGAVDSVVDGVTGLVVPRGDPDALADALQRLIESPAERTRFGAAARARAERDFAAPVVHRNHDRYLRKLLVTDLPDGTSAFLRDRVRRPRRTTRPTPSSAGEAR